MNNLNIILNIIGRFKPDSFLQLILFTVKLKWCLFETERVMANV